MLHFCRAVALCTLTVVHPIFGENKCHTGECPTDYSSALQQQVHVELAQHDDDKSAEKHAEKHAANQVSKVTHDHQAAGAADQVSKVTHNQQAAASTLLHDWQHTHSRHISKRNHESEAGKHKLVTPAPTPEEEADEPQRAPPMWANMLIFFGFATGIFFGMLLLCSFLQLLVRWQREIQEELMAKLELLRKSKQDESGKKQAAGEDPPPSPRHIDDSELALLLHGDHVRFELLLKIANAKSPKTVATELVQKGATANKLKLSDRSVAQACSGILAVAEAANKLHQKRVSTLTPKQKLQRAIQDVRMQLKLTRGSKKNDHKHVDAWTDNDGHAEHHAGKYSDGHKDSMHSGHKTAGLSKVSDSIGAYFASEEWLDHAAIGFIFSYGQVCAICYAMYLKWRFPLMYAFMGPWLLVSRGEAMAIIIYTVFMVLLMCRRFVTYARDYVGWSSTLELIVDKHALMHRCCGGMMVFSAVLHVIGHLRGSLPAIINETDSAEINKAFTYGTKIKFNFNTWKGALQCWPAVTGFGLIFLLLLFWASSNEKARRWNFVLFQYLHLILIVLWCVGLSLHGARQWLGIGVPLGLVAVAPVVLYYAIERVHDILKGITPVIKISDAFIKKRTVLLEIDTGNSGFKYETGMYCMLKVPAISDFEWHPFTIASAGGERYFQVLFAVVGDWTTTFKDLIQDSQKNKTPYPEIGVRGGYGAPAEAMKEKKHIVMVGAGVGATPFLSFLSNICSAAKAGKKSQFDDLRTAAFYWISREPEDFVWVNHYTSLIDSTPSLKDRISVRLCLSKNLETSATDDCNAAELALFWVGVQIALRKLGATDLSKELSAPTQFGRPNWEKEYARCAEEAKKSEKQHQGEGPLEVSIFACGNKMLVESLEAACDTMSDDNTYFRLHAEEF